MRQIAEDRAFYKQLLDMLESHLSAHDELVLHDLTHGYEHTIVDIRNGYVTGRQIGDCGSNLGLEVLRGTVENGDRYNYVTHTKSGRILRSSTMYIRDDGGRVVGSLCVNRDITESVQMEAFLRAENKYALPREDAAAAEREPGEVFFNNVGELLEYLLQSALAQVGRQAALLDREERRRFLKYLDDKGAFVISKSGDRVCEILGISKYTLYNDLESIRKAEGGADASSAAEAGRG